MTKTTQPDPQAEAEPGSSSLGMSTWRITEWFREYQNSRPGGSTYGDAVTKLNRVTTTMYDDQTLAACWTLAAGEPPTREPATVADTGLNADHLPFLARLIDVAERAGVTVVYCCLNADWSIMTSPELDDEAGAAFLAALDVGDVGEPEQKTSRTIFAGPQLAGGVRLYVRPIPTDDTAEDAP